MYASRTVVPLDLRPLVGRREIVRSLETSDLKDARLRAAEWEGHVAGLFRQLRQNGRTMDREQIDALVSQYLDTELQEVETRLATGAWNVASNNHAEHADWNGVARSLLADQAEELEAALAYNNLKATLGIAEQMLPQATMEAQQVLARRLLETKYEAVMAELRALHGKPLPRRTITAVASEVLPKASPLVSKMVADYIAFKTAGGKWTSKTTSQLTNLFRVMVELIGDKSVHDVTKDDMRGLYRMLPQFPTHAPKRYPGLTAVDAIAAADADGQDERLSPKTQNDYFTHIKSLWKWAAENDYVEKSPAVVLKDVDETAAWDQRPAFTDGQLKEYFGSLKIEATSDPAMLWVPRLMLYAGLRTEEAAKLTPEDVRGGQGVYVLDVNRRHGRLKTKNADRLVPIHSAILKDLLKYTAGRVRGENLWGLKANSAGVYSAAVSKRLNGVLDVACPEDDKIVPYSLRHTFATRLKYADVADSVLDELLGHKVEKLSMGRYGKRYPVEKLRDAVERLDVA
jgi:integrase